MTRTLAFFLCVSWCLGSETPADVTGLRSPIDRVLDDLAGNDTLEVSRGVEFVRVNANASSGGDRGRSAGDSVLSRVRGFFTDYELRVKPSDVFRGRQEVMEGLRRAFVCLADLQGGNDETSRGKGGSGFGGGKKGGGAILMMATMLGGTMAALGFGALSMLVMKALTVSAMAFLLSSVIGLRRLLRRPEDDAGFGRISYIPVHAEHRRRRSLHDLPYRAHVK